VGEDTGIKFFRLDSNTGVPCSDQEPPNPFDASLCRPSPSGSYNCFVGSAGLTSAGFVWVGNDDFAFYTLSTTDLTHITTRGTGGIVCSSPSISYVAETGYRWIYYNL